MRMMLQRLLRVAPLALMFASVASAQTTGNIIGVVTDAQSGKPVVGALVVATSPNLQGEQTAVTDKTGGFRFQLLPPGEYKLAAQFDGFKPADRSDLSVRIDKTIRANLALVPEAVQMEEQVVKTGMAPVINVGSAETGVVVSQEFTSNIPVSRGFEAVATVAPGARLDRYGVSFAGASSPENAYILDGMNVSDPAYGVLGAQILNNFVQEIDVKTGAFMPEYGFSTGGVINVVTKSGSNEFHGSVFANYNPGQLRGDATPVSRDAEALAIRSVPNDGAYSADFGFEVGGPIIKDRLWFYAGFAPRFDRQVVERYVQATQFNQTTGAALRNSNGQTIGSELPGTARSFNNDVTAYQLIGKLTYLFNENNSLTLSLTAVPSSDEGVVSTTANGQPNALWSKNQDDFADLVARYSSKLLDKRLILEVTGGWHRQKQQVKPGSFDGVDVLATPGVQWRTTNQLSWFEQVPTACLPYVVNGVTVNPCRVTNYLSGGWGFYDTTILDRFGGKASLTYLADAAGSHNIKGGLELAYTAYDHTKGYSGGHFMRQRQRTPPNPALPAGWYYQDYRQFGYPTGTPDASGLYFPTAVFQNDVNVVSSSVSQAYFIQDSWSPSMLDGLTINAGIRWDIQSMSADIPGSSSFDINDMFGPRVQAIYDWTKQGRSKVSANWGRFYQAIPLDMGDRAFGDERQVGDYRSLCYDPRTDPDKSNVHVAQGPAACAVVDGYYGAAGLTYTQTGATSTPVSPGLKGQYVDMFGAAVEYEVLSDFSVGLDYTGRRLGRAIEDMSSDDGNTYFIANPGEGEAFTAGGVTYDPVTAVATDNQTGRVFNTPWPKPKRDYDGFTVSLRKNYSSNWQALASYTYSSISGNYPGLFRSENGQLDPNLTSEYDLPSLLSNKQGPLASDFPHQFKAFGSYTWDVSQKFQVTAGAAYRIQSGVPINALGAHELYGPSEVFMIGRGQAGRTPITSNADLKGQVGYLIKPPYAIKFSVDVFNVFNEKKVTAVDQVWTTDNAQPIINAQCGSRSGAEGTDPIGGLLADCPSLNYAQALGGNGRAATLNKNFGRPTAYQVPVSFRFGLEFTF